jgi:hypothetical protein
MKRLTIIWMKFILLTAILLLNTIVKADEKSFEISVKNLTQTASNVLEFDVYLLDTDPGQPFELASCQLGFLINSLIYTGGTLSAIIDNTGSGLNSSQQFTATPSLASSLTGYPDQTLVRLAGRTPPGAGNGTIISTSGDGTKLTHFILTSTVDFTSNSTPNIVFNSSTATTPLYPTRVSEYIGTTNTALNVIPGDNANVYGNPLLNPLPTAFNLTGGGSYCEGPGGVAVGLDDSENGVTYKLYRNTTILVSTVSGTGSAISFGNQTAGTYTATGTNVTGTTNMNGTINVTESPKATISLTSGNNNQTVCVNSAITNIIYSIGGGGTGAGVTGLPTGVTGSFSAGTFTITGTPSVSGTFPYTVTTTGTCTQTSANGTITVKALQVPNAGPDQTGSAMCGLTSTTLAANTPTEGTGSWSIVSGTGGNITSVNSPSSTFTGTPGITYVLRWTITNPPCAALYDEVTITFLQNPTTANAGPDQTGASMCGFTSTTLAGNTPAIGAGTWSIISGSGGNIASSSNPASTFTGIAGSTYVLRWTIANSPCPATFDDVIITFAQNPTTANAGPDQTDASMCGRTSTTLAGNSPTVGTGTWSIISGAGGTISSVNNPASNFSGTPVVTYVLRWTISNPPCTSTYDDVTVTFLQNPTTANAGPDQTGSSMCGKTSTTLAANTPAVGQDHGV